MAAPGASQDYNRIRRVNVTTGATTTLAGSSTKGIKDDDDGTNAQFHGPRGVAIDPSGAFALVVVRACPPCTPRGVAFPPAAVHPPRTHAPGPHRRPLKWCSQQPHRAGGLHLAQRVLVPDASQDGTNHRIRRVNITTGATTTLAGGDYGFKDADVGTNAQFESPFGIAIAPSGAFALVGVRVRPPCTPRVVAFPPQRRTRLAHTPQARTAAL